MIGAKQTQGRETERKGHAIGWKMNLIQLVEGFSSSAQLTFRTFHNEWYSQFSSVAQSCPTLRNPMNRSTPGLPVHHQLPELTQTHVRRVAMPSNHLILCAPHGCGSQGRKGSLDNTDHCHQMSFFKNKKQVSELFHLQNSRREVVNWYSVLAPVSPRDAVLLPVLLTEFSQLLKIHRKPFSLFLGHGV